MKKVFMVLVAGTLVLSSCSNKKNFCECLTESMASADPNLYPAGCEYIKDMDVAEITSKSTECLGDIYGGLTDSLDAGMEEMAEEIDTAVDSLSAAIDSAVAEIEESAKM